MLEILSLLIFVLASISFLLVAYIAIKNDPTYRVNQLFALAFIFAFFYFIFMGLYLLPSFGIDATIKQFSAFLVLLFLTCTITTFSIVAMYIKYESLLHNKKDLLLIGLFTTIALVGTYISIFQFNNITMLMVGFTLLGIGLSLNSFKYLIVLYNVGKKLDGVTKKKIYSYNTSFILFNVLSGFGWSMALFLPLSDELRPFPPGIATLIVSLLMVRSFLIKTDK